MFTCIIHANKIVVHFLIKYPTNFMEGHLHDLNSQKLGEYQNKINLCTNNTSAGYSAEKEKEKNKAIDHPCLLNVWLNIMLIIELVN